MIDRQKLEIVLQRRFPGASLEQVAAAANAILGLDADSCCCTASVERRSPRVKRDVSTLAPDLPVQTA